MTPSISRSVKFQLDYDGEQATVRTTPPNVARNKPSRPSLKPPTIKPSSPPPSTSTMTLVTPDSSMHTPPPPPQPAPSSSRSVESSSKTPQYSSPSTAFSDGTDGWRKHGKLHRARLVLNDEQKGGIVLSNNCSIDRYYKVAERVGCILIGLERFDWLFGSHFMTFVTLGPRAVFIHEYQWSCRVGRILFGRKSPHKILVCSSTDTWTILQPRTCSRGFAQPQSVATGRTSAVYGRARPADRRNPIQQIHSSRPHAWRKDDDVRVDLQHQWQCDSRYCYVVARFQR